VSVFTENCCNVAKVSNEKQVQSAPTVLAVLTLSNSPPLISPCIVPKVRLPQIHFSPSSAVKQPVTAFCLLLSLQIMMSLLVPRQIFVLVVLLMLALSASSLRVPSLSRFLRLSRLQQSTAAEQEGATAYIECAAGPEIFQKTVIDASQENPVVVDFYADW
jgi:thiol:disulfide interchange protein